jgi:hypothetical protein
MHRSIYLIFTSVEQVSKWSWIHARDERTDKILICWFNFFKTHHCRRLENAQGSEWQSNTTLVLYCDKTSHREGHAKIWINNLVGTAEREVYRSVQFSTFLFFGWTIPLYGFLELKPCTGFQLNDTTNGLEIISDILSCFHMNEISYVYINFIRESINSVLLCK